MLPGNKNGRALHHAKTLPKRGDYFLPCFISTQFCVTTDVRPAEFWFPQRVQEQGTDSGLQKSAVTTTICVLLGARIQTITLHGNELYHSGMDKTEIIGLVIVIPIKNGMIFEAIFFAERTIAGALSRLGFLPILHSLDDSLFQRVGAFVLGGLGLFIFCPHISPILSIGHVEGFQRFSQSDSRLVADSDVRQFRNRRTFIMNKKRNRGSGNLAEQCSFRYCICGS